MSRQTPRDRALALGVYIAERDTEADVQKRLVFNKFVLRTVILFVLCVVLPINVLLVLYLSVIDVDPETGAISYDDFSGFIFCNMLWCSPPKQSASNLLALSLFIPYAFFLTWGNYTFTRLAVQRHHKYIEEKKQAAAAVEQARVAALWDSPAKQRERFNRVLTKAATDAATDFARQRSEVYIWAPFRWLNRVLRKGRVIREQERALRRWASILRPHAIQPQSVKEAFAMTALCFVQLFILLPLFSAGAFELDLSMSGSTLFTWLIVLLGACVPLYALVKLTLACTSHRASKKQRELLEKRERAASGAHAEDAEAVAAAQAEFDVIQATRAKRFSKLTRLGLALGRQGLGAHHLRWALFLYVCIVFTLSAALPILLSQQAAFPGVSVARGTTRSITFFFIMIPPFAYSTQLLIRSGLTKRNPVRRSPSSRSTLEERLARLARKHNVPAWGIGEFPWFSQGNVIITTGLRRRDMPHLHVGYRLKYRLLPRIVAALVVFPLVVLLPLQQHLPQFWSLLDDWIQLSPGTVSNTALAIACGMPTCTILTYASVFLWYAIPAPTRAAAPVLGLWLLCFGAIPLVAFLALSSSVQTGVGSVFIRALLGFPLSVLAQFIVLSPKIVPAAWHWIHSLRLEQKYHDLVARAGISFSLFALLSVPVWVIWCAILLLFWETLYRQLMVYILCTVVIFSGFAIAAGTIWGIASARFFDYVTPNYGPYRVRPMSTLALALFSVAIAMETIAEYKPGFGGLSNVVAFFGVRKLLVMASVTFVTVFPTLSQLWNHYSQRKRFGYHPELWETVNPILSQRPWEATGEIVNYERDDYFASEDDEVAIPPDMNLAERALALQTSGVFQSLSNEMLLNLAARVRRYSFTEGDLIFRAGSAAVDFWIVERGTVQLATDIPAHELRKLPPGVSPTMLANAFSIPDGRVLWRTIRADRGQVFGDRASTSATMLHQHYAVALGFVEVLRLTYTEFAQLMLTAIFPEDINSAATMLARKITSRYGEQDVDDMVVAKVKVRPEQKEEVELHRRTKLAE